MSHLKHFIPKNNRYLPWGCSAGAGYPSWASSSSQVARVESSLRALDAPEHPDRDFPIATIHAVCVRRTYVCVARRWRRTKREQEWWGNIPSARHVGSRSLSPPSPLTTPRLRIHYSRSI
ncbi:hypothetical protein PUN28_017461 [Cardiocondyla obscurior]|uniref:Uncharacterized protein n=1 Tax=Cardiocondyla obscurior TaxID=286306 RepID=A0AAW2EHE4_9HYME